MNKKFLVSSIFFGIFTLFYIASPTSSKTPTNLASPPMAPISLSKVDESESKLLKTKLVVQMIDSTIKNPYYGVDDNVRLRGYTCVRPFREDKLILATAAFDFSHCLSETSLKNNNTTNPQHTTFLVAPMLEVAPGDRLEIEIENRLDENSDAVCKENELGKNTNINIPHCFNNTNLHTHGLWGDPDKEDDVLTTIPPKQSKTYSYSIRKDHPAGTFWYHPHVHGSTAIQVGSGMAGALIIRGDRNPVALTLNTNSELEANDNESEIIIKRGDLDTLLWNYCTPGSLGNKPCTPTYSKITTEKTINAPVIEERVMLFQQIQYSCGDVNANNKLPPQCTDKNPGVIESYDKLGPSGWKDSKRFTSINGSVLPEYYATKNRLQRLRMIHAGIRDTLNVKIYKLKPTPNKSFAEIFGAISSNNSDALLDGNPLTQFMVATDGLTLPQIVEQNQTILQPGYRADILVNFPEVGQYVIFDGETPSDGSVNQAQPSVQALAFVTVESAPEGEEQKLSPRDFIRNTLLALSELKTNSREYDEFIKAKIRRDLKTNDGVMSLDSFTAHQPISEAQLTTTKVRKIEFNIDTGTSPTRFEINRSTYSGEKVDQLLTLGAIEEWHLTSKLAGHPFHIHVNPFEIIAVYNKQGIDVSNHRKLNIDQKIRLVSSVDSSSIELSFSAQDDDDDDDDAQYIGLKGAYKDTIFVKPGYTVVIRSHYKTFTGDFVLHCHILDHEDQGMMQYVRICNDDESKESCVGKPLRGHTGHKQKQENVEKHLH